MAQPPSFPFYPADWVLGTLTFTLAEDGAYLRLVMHQWNAGSVPGDDLSAVAKILRVSEREARVLWKVVSTKFVRGDDGQWRNARLEKQRDEKVRYHEAKRTNGLKGGRPAKKRDESEPEPTGSVSPNRNESLSLALVPVPNGTESAREGVPLRREPALRPNPYAHAQMQAPNGRVFWEGPIFSIPDGWARRVLKASNGKAAGSDVVKFAQQLTAKLERDGGEAPTVGFLGWLDTEWAAYRQPAVSDGYRPASEWIEQNRKDSEGSCTPEEARAILDAARAKMRPAVTHG